MKKIGFYLAHPAHFHLFKNVIESLVQRDCKVLVVYNEKDVLHELISTSSFFEISHRVKSNKKVESKIALLLQFFMKNWGAFLQFYKFKPDAVVGTPILISLIGRLLPYKSIIVNEDDFDIVKKTANFGYPHADTILCPEVCRTTKFDKKSIKYQSYHELAYLHPNHFKADLKIATNYINNEKPYFILRFAKLFAHHDDGITGINSEVAARVVNILKPHGNIYITSERTLEPEFEKYRISIHAKDMHHVMAFASLYIGDSQTMAAESGVLGTPFIRFNDFVGRISYLDELENKYYLGYGIKTNNIENLYQKIKDLLDMENCKDVFKARRYKMLTEKIDYSAFLTWFIDNYPESKNEMVKNSDYQYKFK